MCPPRKERERSPDQRALRLFQVLHRWIDHWTRLPTKVLMPCVVENQRAIVTGSRQPTHCLYCLSLESTRRQNVSWESCSVIDPSVEHSRKPKSMLIRASFSFFSRWTHAQWTLNASSVSARDQSRPDSPPPMLEHKFRINKFARIKQRGGGEPGDEANPQAQFPALQCCTLKSLLQTHG